MSAWKRSLGHFQTILETRYISNSISCYVDGNNEYWASSFAVIDIDNIK